MKTNKFGHDNSVNSWGCAYMGWGKEAILMAWLMPVSGTCFQELQRGDLRRISLSGAGLICLCEYRDMAV